MWIFYFLFNNLSLSHTLTQYAFMFKPERPLGHVPITIYNLENTIEEGRNIMFIASEKR